MELVLMMSSRRWLGAALLVLACTACAGTPPVPDVPPRRQLSDVTKPGEVPSQISDPIEGWNRGVYKFNAQFDSYVFLPVVDGYRSVTPEFVRDRIHDFFSNLTEITTFVNATLQLKGDTAGRAALRFVNNVMFGFGGLYDITAAKGIAQVKEDFGQTLGHWGVGEGPYLVLPILGPSNLRDTGGLVVDNIGSAFLVPGNVGSSPPYMATSYGLRPVDKRNSIPFRYYRSGSPFEYEFVRVIYTRFREAAIAR
jgi:phospholipid-binding lipoprotein MlaA